MHGGSTCGHPRDPSNTSFRLTGLGLEYKALRPQAEIHAFLAQALRPFAQIEPSSIDSGAPRKGGTSRHPGKRSVASRGSRWRQQVETFGVKGLRLEGVGLRVQR